MSLLTALERNLLQAPGLAFADLQRLMMAMMNADAELGSLTEGEPASSFEARASRLVALVGAMLLDRRFQFNDAQFLGLFKLASHFRSIAVASGFRGTDHLLLALGVRDTASLLQLARTDRQAFVRACLLLTLDTRLPIDVEVLLDAEPQLGGLVSLMLISNKMIATPEGQQRRTRLVAAAARMRPFLPNDLDYLVIASNAWMICSYTDLREKHALKGVLNRYLRPWLEARGLSDRPDLPPPGRGTRPTMVVASEIMHSNHVQYRYFGQYLRQLRTRFRLVLVTQDSEIDDHVRQLFDEVRPFQRGRDVAYLRTVRDLIVSADPDVVFWPSVGMRHWGTALANLRLAPLQITALGHSASTFCDTIDYYLTEEGYVGDPDLFGERLLLLPDASLRFERSPHFDPAAVPKVDRSRRPVLRIALPSNLLKMNHTFVETLRRIESAADRPLAFKVFPNVRGAELAMTRRVLGDALRDVTVMPVLGYQAYIAELATCDINLSPFPFGGLHSVVDSMRLGIPVVAMEGLEPHARTDAMLLRRLRMPEWLINHTVDDYVACALRLIGNDALRLKTGRQAHSANVGKTLFGDASTPLRTEVADAVWWAFENHERLRGTSQKVFTQADWGVRPALRTSGG
ncbi:MAG: hypothetical protein FGM40_05645 [Rhodocyclaceae bacterium]|nr:hypothetical protein [Rhodocyclaceae bacterium]